MSILDQYGQPASPAKNPEAAKYRGYELVARDGFGKSVYLQYDPVMGILRLIRFNGDGTYDTQSFQNVQAMADAAKLYRDHHKKNPKSGYQRQAVLPPNLYWEFMKKCGWKPGQGADFDKKKMDQLINDPNFSKFKARPGKISIQTQRWV